MNTKTMHLPPRRFSTPNKRKEREELDGPTKRPKPTVQGPYKACSEPTTAKSLLASQAKPAHNQVLAGYLAHEFMTKGTLFGEVWDQVRADRGAEVGKNDRYVEVANLLKEEGTHLPGIVNPTQLARYLNL